MLVLSRQKDESIMIGDNVEITIVDIRGNKVRLGITAAKEIPVHRREVYDAIQREKKMAKESGNNSENNSGNNTENECGIEPEKENNEPVPKSARKR
jgi:carbon storage regulator